MNKWAGLVLGIILTSVGGTAVLIAFGLVIRVHELRDEVTNTACQALKNLCELNGENEFCRYCVQNWNRCPYCERRMRSREEIEILIAAIALVVVGLMVLIPGIIVLVIYRKNQTAANTVHLQYMPSNPIQTAYEMNQPMQAPGYGQDRTGMILPQPGYPQSAPVHFSQQMRQPFPAQSLGRQQPSFGQEKEGYSQFQ